MRFVWEKLISTMGALGLTLALTFSFTVTILFILGWRTEWEKTDTEISLKTDLNFRRRSETHVQEGETPRRPQEASVTTDTPAAPPVEPPAPRPVSDERPPYVGGNYVSGKSTIRYVIEDRQGQVEMYGYDVMRGRRVFVGSGRLVGRRLIIPRFYSFLDNTYGTLKVDLAKNGNSLEGYFEGEIPAREARVVLVRLP